VKELLMQACGQVAERLAAVSHLVAVVQQAVAAEPQVAIVAEVVLAVEFLFLAGPSAQGVERLAEQLVGAAAAVAVELAELVAASPWHPVQRRLAPRSSLPAHPYLSTWKAAGRC
jgi:hypothetical protein